MRLQFDFPGPDGWPAPVVFRDPVRVIVARSIEDVPRAFAEAEAALSDGRYVAGAVCYEAASGFDAALATQPAGAFPLVWFGVFDAPAAEAPPSVDADRQSPVSGGPGLQVRMPVWSPAITPEAHAQGVARIREAIADGETYQINYTFRLTADAAGVDGAALYRCLAAAERVPYGAHLDFGEWQLVSLSPELFFRRAGGRLTTQPMKGTAARGRWSDEDDARAMALAGSEKERAENVMIVDLMRNDLTQVCMAGSVAASSLFHVDRYPSVLQMVSTVSGALPPEVTLGDIFAALFPAGSITGAPKSSSMRLIAALEHAPRGVYCGAIGYAGPGGDAVFNVAIRTATIHVPSGAATYGVGGGITWDSQAADEYAEAMSKARCLTPPASFGLIETFRAEQGVPVRFDRHLARLAASAAYFGRPCDTDAIRAAVAAHLAVHGDGVRRVRLGLGPEGQITVDSRPPDSTPSPAVVALASTPVDGRDPFLCHKTTRRAVYDAHRAAHPDVFDVLLWNEAGEITEFTNANVVIELDGQRCTPPRECGLLPGVYREALLRSGSVQTRVIRLEDLARATQIFWVNSFRGAVSVHCRRRP